MIANQWSMGFESSRNKAQRGRGMDRYVQSPWEGPSPYPETFFECLVRTVRFEELND